MTDADRCTAPVVIDRCRCPEIRGPEDFRDSVSHDEWSRTGRCQYCQDLAFIATADVHARPWLPDYHLGRGALFARSDAVDETVLLPFTFGAPDRPPALDLHAIVRVGPSHGRLEPLDPRAALACLRPLLETHSIRVAAATGLDDPILERFAPCAVLIGFQPQAMADVVHDCPPFARALPDRHILEFCEEPDSLTVAFETAIALFGLDRTHTPRSESVEPLRLCAWIAAALHLPEPAGGTLFDAVLRHHVRPATPAPVVPVSGTLQ